MCMRKREKEREGNIELARNEEEKNILTKFLFFNQQTDFILLTFHFLCIYSIKLAAAAAEIIIITLILRKYLIFTRIMFLDIKSEK